jgi:hypothetical protein
VTYATRLFIPATTAGIALRNVAVQLLGIANRLKWFPKTEYSVPTSR